MTMLEDTFTNSRQTCNDSLLKTRRCSSRTICDKLFDTVFLFLVKGIAKLLHQMKQDRYVFYFRPYSGGRKILKFEVGIKNMMNSHWKWFSDWHLIIHINWHKAYRKSHQLIPYLSVSVMVRYAFFGWGFQCSV